MYAEVSWVVYQSNGHFFIAFVALLRGASRERQDSTYRISGAHELGNIDGDLPLGEGAVFRHVDYINI
jgi:hypothetical protein